MTRLRTPDRLFHLLVAVGLTATSATLVAATTAAPAYAADPVPPTQSLHYTGAAQTWTVPEGVTKVTFDLYGAGGEGLTSSTTRPGYGARVTQTLTVTPGEVFEVNVGGRGYDGLGGFNGGGNGGEHGGGGATDIRPVGGTLADRILVAGGGGGSANCGFPAGKGGDGGSWGGYGGASTGCYVNSGGGGRDDQGGTATSDATPGTFGLGGNAGAAAAPSYFTNPGQGNGGGGGGGWYGGGGGAWGGAGGGGSSFPRWDGAQHQTGVRQGHGLFTVTYLNPVTTTTVTLGNSHMNYGETNPQVTVNVKTTDSRLYLDQTPVQLYVDGEPYGPVQQLGWTGKLVLAHLDDATPSRDENWEEVKDSALDAGYHTISARFLGARPAYTAGNLPDLQASTSADANLYVSQGYAAATITGNVSPTYGEPTGIRATVTANYPWTSETIPNRPAPQGTVHFIVDNELYGDPQPLNGAGVAQLPTGPGLAPLEPGYHHVHAQYTGDGNYYEGYGQPLGIDIARPLVDVAVTPDESSVTYGDPLPAVRATVVAANDTLRAPTGPAQFYLDGAAYGDPQQIGTDGSVTMPTLPDAALLGVGTHEVKVSYAGDSLFATSTGLAALTVAQQPSTTTLTVTPENLTATVTTPEPGTTSGTVNFFIDGTKVGQAPVTDGIATWSGDTTRTANSVVAAIFTGNDNVATSSASTARANPVVTAHVGAPGADGWHSEDVTVTYTCEAGSGAIDCPAPRTVTNGKDQVITATVVAADGGVTTAATSPISVDTVKPTAQVRGLTQGAVYNGAAPKATCSGTDALSGVASCTLATIAPTRERRSTVATVTDVAGHTATAALTYRVRHTWVTASTYRNGAWSLPRRGRELHMMSDTRPKLLNRDGTKAPFVLAGTLGGVRHWIAIATAPTNTRIGAVTRMRINTSAGIDVVAFRTVA